MSNKKIMIIFYIWIGLIKNIFRRIILYFYYKFLYQDK